MNEQKLVPVEPTEKMKPCPFCGDDAEKGRQEVTMMNDERDQFVRVTCRVCGCMCPKLNWNTRAAAPTAQSSCEGGQEPVDEVLVYDAGGVHSYSPAAKYYTHAPDFAAALAAKDAEIARLTQAHDEQAGVVAAYARDIEKALHEMQKAGTPEHSPEAAVALLAFQRDESIDTIAQQAERIKELESSYSNALNRIVNFEDMVAEYKTQLATANALIASKDALIEQARVALVTYFRTFRVAENVIAAIERHQKGENNASCS